MKRKLVATSHGPLGIDSVQTKAKQIVAEIILFFAIRHWHARVSRWFGSHTYTYRTCVFTLNSGSWIVHICTISSCTIVDIILLLSFVFIVHRVCAVVWCPNLRIIIISLSYVLFCSIFQLSINFFSFFLFLFLKIRDRSIVVLCHWCCCCCCCCRCCQQN